MEEELSNDYDIVKRVRELHDKLGIVTQNKTTTSIGLTEDKMGIVGSSEGRLRQTIRQELYDFEIEAKGEPGKHAEEYVIIAAEKHDKKITEIASSRDICIDCQELIEKNEIISKTPFNGLKSNKRKNNEQSDHRDDS